MITLFTNLTILAAIVFKLAGLVNAKLGKSRKYLKLVDYSVTDKILRIIQYVASGLYAHHDGYYSKMLDYLGVDRNRLQEQLLYASFHMGYARKALRVLRGALNLQSVVEKTPKIQFAAHKASYSELADLFLYLSDITDVVFYLTDHFHTLYTMKVLTNHDLCDQLEFIGNVAWSLGALCLLICYICMALSIRSKEKTRENHNKLAICDLEILSAILEFVLGICFIYPKLMSRQAISGMVIVSSVAKLLRLNYK